MKKRVYTDCREINGKRAIYQIHEEMDKTTGAYQMVGADKIANEIHLLGQGQTPDGNYVLIVGFENEMGFEKRNVKALIHRSELGESKCFSKLRAQGCNISTKRTAIDALNDYLQEQGKGLPYCPILSQSGLATHQETGERFFVLPNGEIFGQGEETPQVYFSAPAQKGYETKGTVKDWRNQIGDYLRGNPFMMFGVGVSLSAPLLNLVHADPFIAHLFGQSSTGKSTIEKISASVWGNHRSLVMSWNNTPLAVIEHAKNNNNLPLFYDELGQADSKTVDANAYNLGNGKSKGQGNKEGGIREIVAFANTVLSTGETDLETKIAEGGKRIKAGQEVRFLSIPIAPAQVFHGLANGKTHADHLNKACNLFYGAVGRESLRKIINQDEIVTKALYNTKLKKWQEMIPAHASAQVQRVGKHFALIETTFILAHDLLGWTEQECEQALLDVFEAWVKRYGLTSKEEQEIIHAIEDFVLRYQDGQFKSALTPADRERLIYDCKGHIGENKRGIFVFMSDTVLKELYKSLGYGKEQALQVLRKEGIIIGDELEKIGRLSREELRSLGDDPDKKTVTGYHLYLPCLNGGKVQAPAPNNQSNSPNENHKTLKAMGFNLPKPISYEEQTYQQQITQNRLEALGVG